MPDVLKHLVYAWLAPNWKVHHRACACDGSPAVMFRVAVIQAALCCSPCKGQRL